MPGLLDRILAFLEPKHVHRWRPCKSDRGLGRFCSKCRKVQPLSDADFFMYFGDLLSTAKVSDLAPAPRPR